MLQWVCERARGSRAEEVWIATDDERIAAVARGFGAAVVLTSAAHPSGTDRIAEAAWLLRWAAEDVVVNLQADEPLMPPALIDQVNELLVRHPHAAIATLATPIASLEEFLDPNAVKVVTNRDGRARQHWRQSRAAADYSHYRSRQGQTSSAPCDAGWFWRRWW